MSGGLVADSSLVARAGFRCGESGTEDQRDPYQGSPAAAIRAALIEELELVGTTVLKRHNKYGPKNIANAPGGPVAGILVRLHDKMSRLSFGVDNHEDESVEDAFIDIAGYGLIALLVLHGKWPGT